MIGLASYRLFRLLVEDEIFMGPVEWSLARMPEWFNKMWRCCWCIGTWIAFGVTWATDAVVGLDAPALIGLAAAVVVGWLGENL